MRTLTLTDADTLHLTALLQFAQEQLIKEADAFTKANHTGSSFDEYCRSKAGIAANLLLKIRRN